MAVLDLYSKRKKALEEAGKPQLLKYDELPQRLRVQIIHIWNRAIGPCRFRKGIGGELFGQKTWSWELWAHIREAMCKELGVFVLAPSSTDPCKECASFLLNADTDVDNALDIVELTFWYIDQVLRDSPYEMSETGITQDPDDAISELNARFREHSVGYRFEGEIIRTDSEYLHSQAVGPAIQLLHAEGFKGAEDEFMEGHKHYRKGRNKDAIVWALKAFESTMKSICGQMDWTCPSTATASTLISVCLSNHLIPQYLQNHFNGLRITLESGLPTVRNKGSAHGQGSKPVRVPSSVAGYALHLAATNIVFLVECFKALKK